MENKKNPLTDDHMLWTAFRQGDEHAFGNIVEKYAKAVFNYGIKFSADREFVKDCIQELFYEMWSRRDTLGDVELIKFYLFKSIRRKIYRESSRSVAATQETDLDWASENVSEESVEREIIEMESMQERILRLNRQILQLSKRQQEAIHLKFFEELDNESIAQIMSISKQAVANMLFRSIRELKSNI